MAINAAEQLDQERVDAALERCAKKIVELGLEAPVQFALELHKPLTSIVYNGTLLLTPIATPFFGAERLHTLQLALAKRENIEQLMELIETYSLAQNKKKLKK